MLINNNIIVKFQRYYYHYRYFTSRYFLTLDYVLTLLTVIYIILGIIL